MMSNLNPLALIALLALALDARGQEQPRPVDEAAAPKATPLTGAFYLREPVPLAGPFQTLLHSVKIGDKVLLQIAYGPEGSVIAKSVTTKSENASLTVIDVVNTGRRLAVPDKAGDATPSRAGTCFAVLVRADAAGKCGLLVTCEMSDGSTHKVPFQFKVEK